MTYKDLAEIARSFAANKTSGVSETANLYVEAMFTCIAKVFEEADKRNQSKGE